MPTKVFFQAGNFSRAPWISHSALDSNGKKTFCFVLLLLLLFLNWANSAITKQTDNVCVSVFRVDFRKRKWTKQTLQFTAALLCHKVQIGERLRRSITAEAHKHNSLDQQTAPAEKSSRQQKSTIKRKNKKPATGNEILIFTIYFPVVSFSAPFHQHTIWLILANRMMNSTSPSCRCVLFRIKPPLWLLLHPSAEYRMQNSALLRMLLLLKRSFVSLHYHPNTVQIWMQQQHTFFTIEHFFAFFPFTAKN